MTEFQYQQSQQSAFEQYVQQVLKQQMDENPEAVYNLLQFQYSTGGEFFQALQQYGAPPSSSPYREESMAFDSMEITDSQQYGLEQQSPPMTPENVREQFFGEEYIAESEDEDDPLEFDTLQEAQQYAQNISLDLLDEIIAEIIAEDANKPGVLDLDDKTKAEWCMQLVLSDVWEAMTI